MYNCDQPVFIIGCPRSGTSLLARILNRHSRICVPYESHLYEKFSPRIGVYGDLEQPRNRRQLVGDMIGLLSYWTPSPSLERSLAAMRTNDLHGAIDGVFAAWSKDRGKARWGEKTPAHTLLWREIFEGFPEARFVHILRDPRDVASSWVRSRFGPKHPYMAARRWSSILDTVDDARSAIPGEQFLEIRYEDLVTHPASTVESLCEFLAEDFEPGMLYFHEETSLFETDRRNMRNLGKPIMSGNAFKWRTHAASDEIRLVEAGAKERMLKAGYDPVNADATLSRTEALYCRYLVHPALRLKAMLANVEGHREALRELPWRIRCAVGALQR